MTRAEHIKYLRSEKRASSYALEVHYIANGCCDNCSEIDEKVVNIDEEIKNPALPYNKCTRPHTSCVCCYAVRIRFDENDNPIMK